MNSATDRIFSTLLRRAQRLTPGLHVRLRVGLAREFPRARDYAYCTFDQRGLKIVVAPKFLRATPERQAGLLAHELGHAILLHRGRENHAEVAADVVGSKVAGRRVRYDGEDVQTVGRGKKKRPVYLPK